jgi:hypothetical protein
MDYLEFYKRKVVNTGGSETQSMIDVSKRFIGKYFKEYPDCRTLQITDFSNTVHDVMVRVTEGKEYKEKRLILYPDFHFDIGCLVDFNNEKWIITDKFENQLSDVIKIELCNGEMIFQTPPTLVLIGTTPWGEEQYQEIPGSTITIPCIVQSVRELYDGDSEQINVVDTRIALKIQNQTNEYIAVGKEFEIFNTKYRIYGIDRSQTIKDKGVLIVLAEKL